MQLGLTQEELAHRSGMSSRAIRELEAGRTRPRRGTMALLAEALDLPVASDEAAILLDAVDGTAAAPVGPIPAQGDGPRFQLPTDTRAFTGRAGELELLLALGEKSAGGFGAGTAVVASIDGMAGIGKSALAIHAAHRLREHFPDGQLFVDLQGHTPGVGPLDAGDALDSLLRSLGVPPQLVPKDQGERAAFYRHRLAETRTLILLDNAASTAQVRPLLPATPGCLVLVTSRKHLSGLDDAHSVTLDVLPDAEAASLLHDIAGPGRIPADHPAVSELITLCGRMPLAIRIVAARLRHRRVLQIDGVVERLRDEHGRLDRLRDEERDLAAVFGSSYAELSQSEQTLFRRLGLLYGADTDVYAAANLIDADHAEAEELLDSLVDHNLLTQQVPGRYRFHDLIRLYACRLAAETDPAEIRAGEAALERLLDHYLHTSTSAARFLVRYASPGLRQPGPAPATSPVLADRADALGWMRAERDNLLAAVMRVDPPRVIAFTAALAPFLQQEGPWEQAGVLHRTAAATACRQGDRLGEAWALSAQGRVRYLAGDYSAAGDLHERALVMFREAGERAGQAAALAELGRVRYLNSDHMAACDAFEESVKLFQALGERLGEADCLTELGRVRELSGEYAAAADLHERALAIFLDLGERLGEANALRNLSRVRRLGGEFLVTADLLEQALAIYRDLGDRRSEASALWDTGRLVFHAGDLSVAADLLGQALMIYRDLGHRHGEANALWDLGRVRLRIGDVSAASDLVERALVIYQDLDVRYGEGYAMCTLGEVRYAAGDFSSAVGGGGAARGILHAHGDSMGQANVYLHFGSTRHATQEYLVAADLLERARVLFEELGDRQGMADALNHIGALVADSTGPGEALAVHRQALTLAQEIGSTLDEAEALEGIARCAWSLGDRETARTDIERAVALYQRIGAAGAAAAGAFRATLGD
jgi:tetratricopeptide (TPR) repeat protein/transcriptional regulator with XRE-family HTH domain